MVVGRSELKKLIPENVLVKPDKGKEIARIELINAITRDSANYVMNFRTTLKDMD